MGPEWTKSALCTVVLTAAALIGPAPAGAAPDASPAAPNGTSGSAAVLWDAAHGASTATSDAEIRRVVDAYWTPERMASAVPADAPPTAAASVDPASAGPASAGQARQRAAAPKAAEVTAAYPTAPVGAQSLAAVATNATGKVFYRNASDGANYVCSASAISSGSKRLVLTAGHCVHGGQGGTWHQNWIFVPGYNRGTRPLGNFPASSFRTFDAFTTSGDFTRDVAFVVTGTNSTGALVVNAAGGHGFVANAGTTVSVNVAGYPNERENGEVQLFCTGTTRAYSAGPGSQIDCGFTGGASGGPWLRDSGSNGLGFAVSETMGITGSTSNYGPAFDSAVLNMYNAVKDQTS